MVDKRVVSLRKDDGRVVVRRFVSKRVVGGRWIESRVVFNILVVSVVNGKSVFNLE